ncbi:MAG: tRNA pseudouridine(13) synthase TruD [Gammaproteobacteria bacterium]|nr:tRNA pseudouridine(13) synthase TruD [Gammaproteobacteria bacterium]
MQNLPDWARASGATLFAARSRSTAADFVVNEDLSIDFSNDGEHDLLHVEKSGANTQWVAERLAEHAGVPARDVGFAGLKDRHALTRQWFSVRRPAANGTDWATFDAAGVRILEQRRHRRKLRRGAHKGNAFRIALRGDDIESQRQMIAARLSSIAVAGVPNYFGEQRFGRGGANLELCRALFAGKRLSRARRSIALSAARSFIFNEILALRVQTGSWNAVQPGELANLDGSGSVFAVAEVTAEFDRRCDELDIHPSGTLWGNGAPLGGSTVAALESGVAAVHPEFCDGLVRAGVKASSRALRLRVYDLQWHIQAGALWLEFVLGRGGYATAVIREIAATSQQPPGGD